MSLHAVPSIAHSIIALSQIIMKLSVALATLAVGGASAFSVNQNGLRTSTQLNAVRQPIMAGNWKVTNEDIKMNKCICSLSFSYEMTHLILLTPCYR